MYPLPLGCRAAAAYENHAADHQDRGQYFLPCERIYSVPDAYDCRDDGLNIGIHTHQRRPDQLLAIGNEKVCHEGRKENEIAYFPSDIHWNRGIVGAQHTPERNGQRNQKREKKTPLHERHDAVFGNKRAEQAQIKREAQAVYKQQHYAKRRRSRSSSLMYRVENQKQYAGKTEGDASGFLAGDWLFQEKECKEHCEDGPKRSYDGRIDGGRHGNGHKESHLGDEQTHERCRRDSPEVFPVHLLFGHA